MINHISYVYYVEKVVKQISRRNFDEKGLYYSNSSIWPWRLSNLMKSLPVIMRSPNPTARAIRITLKLCKYKYCFGKWALFCLFCLWMRKNPIWDVTVLPQTSAVFSTTYSASQEGKGKVHGICQIDYTSKFPVIQNSKFLNHLLRRHFKQRSKPNILEICHSCTI